MHQLELTKRVGGMQKRDFVSLFSLPSAPTKYIAAISDPIYQKIETAISLIKENDIILCVGLSVEDFDNCYLILEFDNGHSMQHSTKFRLVVLPKKIAIRFYFENETAKNTVTAEYDYSK